VAQLAAQLYTIREFTQTDRSYNQEALPWHEEICELVDDFGTGVRQLYRDLYATLRHGAPLVITPESVRRQVAILEKCRELSPVWAGKEPMG
jgi:hypothetical protein